MLVVLRVKDVPPCLRGNFFIRTCVDCQCKIVLVDFSGRLCIIIFLILINAYLKAQVLGGRTAFNFLDLPNTPQLTALGGVNISNRSDDVSLSFTNPALLRKDMTGQVHATFNLMYADIRSYHLFTAVHDDKLNTNFSLGISYIDYGSIESTDESGNILGEFRPRDYIIQTSFSRQYESRWHYGFSFKFIGSEYGQYHSNAVAIDASGTYYDSVNSLQAALVIKNMGTQLKKYNSAAPEQLPFDISLGISKKLTNAPVQFSLTAYHLQNFNIRYADSTINADLGGNQNGSYTLDKIVRHIIFAVQFFLDKKVELTLGYNHLRRKELSIYNSANGLTGLSGGVGIILNKLQLRYALSFYQPGKGYNQFGIGMILFK